MKPVMAQFVGADKAFPVFVQILVDDDVSAAQLADVEATSTFAKISEPDDDVQATGDEERVVGLAFAY